MYVLFLCNLCSYLFDNIFPVKQKLELLLLSSLIMIIVQFIIFLSQLILQILPKYICLCHENKCINLSQVFVLITYKPVFYC